MATVSEKDGMFWSLVAWGGGVVAFLVVYVVTRSLFGGTAPDGLVFAAVAFIVVASVLTARLGPRDADPVVPHAAPVAAPRPAVMASVAAPVAAAPVVQPVEGHSERVSEAAREAARLAADLDAPVATPTRPERMDAPRDGTPDNLKKIKGVGPKLEELLHKLGYYHFDQIATWTPEEIAWVDTNIEDFPGRATRDDWVGQSKVLMAGGTTEFSQRVDRGEVY
ncbi:MAG: NADH:ubiquinone oxidoreductase [Amaricoccus sp.]|uniref:NADH:ubiquinone oxidoreductase n=1 Tax=Amaricoccus sp. TaxID=1872485 RepID=UPI0039E2F29A